MKKMNENGASEDWTSYDIRSGYTIINEFDMALLAKDVVRRNRAIKVMHQYAADMFGIRLRAVFDPVTKQGSIPLGRVIAFRNEVIKRMEGAFGGPTNIGSSYQSGQ